VTAIFRPTSEPATGAWKKLPDAWCLLSLGRQIQSVALDQARDASAKNAQADYDTIVALKAGGDGGGHGNYGAHGDVEATAYKLRLII
jgi:hypothetical protein